MPPINEISYEGVVERIQKIYNSCTPQEQEYLKQILIEIADTGQSQTYEEIWLADYKEIPVDINTFISSETYLGKTNRKGAAVYPFWKKELNTFFNAGNKYHEWILTGATRIGKSSTAITGVAYMLYKLMCLRDPQKYFGKKEISKFSILFFNLTKELAKGVGFREFNDTLQVSPWFQAHGTFSKSEQNFYYIPEGDRIVINYGSSGAMALGQQVFCVVGGTRVCTMDGVYSICALAYQVVKLLQYDYEHKTFIYTDGVVVPTKIVEHTVRIIFTNGCSIEATEEHPIMLSNGTYKKFGEITRNDTVMSMTSDTDIKIKRIVHLNYKNGIQVYDVINAIPYHNFVIESNNSKFILHNCAFVDEMNFSRTGVKDVQKAKATMAETYNIISARVKGTFKHGGEVFGKIFAVSSKRSDSDFMEAYVQEQLDAGAGDHMFISDAPQWEVLPPGTYSKEKFYIAVGNQHQRGFVIPDNQCFPEALDDLKTQGYQILTPPLDMKSDFIADFHVALRDLAGIAVVGALSFITQDSLTKCITNNRRNPFYNDILQIGLKDNYSVEEFFHIEEIPATLRRFPMFIHLDLSLTTDRTGISMCCISDRKDIETETGSVISQPYFSHIFSLAIEAPRGDKIPYSKVVAFICWLRKQGFQIDRISRDQFQSEYLAQQLEEKGFTVDKISLDRTPDGYIAVRSMLLEQRIDMLDCSLLQDELIHLQRDAISGKIDHPVGGSKDVADSFAGSLWNAILNNPGVKIPAKKVVNAIKAINSGSSRNINNIRTGIPGNPFSGFLKK